MKKKLSKVGYTAEIIFNNDWKVVIKFNDKERYFYIFNSKEEAIIKFDEMI